MQIELAYGKVGLVLDLPETWDVTVIEPKYIPGLPDPAAALRQALGAPLASPPLSEMVRPGMRVGIVFSDITRPAPHKQIIPAILAELAHIPPQDITLFTALGTHRPNTDRELRSMLGDELVERYRIVQNNAFDPTTQVKLGVTSFGHEIWLNQEIMACDLKILTGFIEPHMFAGFSGGGKALMPGMAGLSSVLGNHGAANISHPKATWGITHGNPIWEEIQQAAQMAGQTFLVNVTLNRDKHITGVYAGNVMEAHAAGCAFVRQAAMTPVEQPFDIIVTTNSGYPLDLNLYQSVKGMSAASQIVREGGAILIAAECWDGVPEHGLYAQLLRQSHSPQDLLARIFAPDFLEQDQWQVQIQAQIQLKADVYVYSEYLSDEQIKAALLKPCRDIPETVATLRSRFGPQSRICVLPEGPQTIPYLETRTS
jgi:nickel-dependent lactate racemase